MVYCAKILPVSDVHIDDGRVIGTVHLKHIDVQKQECYFDFSIKFNDPTVAIGTRHGQNCIGVSSGEVKRVGRECVLCFISLVHV